VFARRLVQLYWVALRSDAQTVESHKRAMFEAAKRKQEGECLLDLAVWFALTAI
jgi:hypothetical protein